MDKKNPDKSLNDFKQLICLSDDEIEKTNSKIEANKPKKLKYWIGFAVSFAIFCALGQLGGEKIVGFFRGPAFDKELTEIAGEINKTCPFMVDRMTRLDNTIVLANRVIQYNYTFINPDSTSIDLDALKNNLELIMINKIKTDPQLKIMRENKVTLNESYRDIAGKSLFLIAITPDKYQ